ncbi:HAD family phosphatase [uncultured Ilyobacter sp.]|uniref:HAD family hydrolase n=1 Tax=uncultured Ilyobacter sp. TaxID=544433 RepID=UPI0029C08B0F|nr:HAD family phosphatase [uncultured Ilyobacter sp.]
MIKNIIFDLGRVLLNFEPLEYTYKKIPDKQRAYKIYQEVFKSNEWIMLDRGVITEEEAINRICDRNLENDQLIREVMNNWYEILTPMKDVVEILKKLKLMGYKIYFLSNFHLLAFEKVSKKYDFFRNFEGGIVSYRENQLKPENEIYNTLSDRYDINPSESIFIDDTKENIISAEKLGFKTVLFTSSIDLKEKLLEYDCSL